MPERTELNLGSISYEQNLAGNQVEVNEESKHRDDGDTQDRTLFAMSTGTADRSLQNSSSLPTTIISFVLHAGAAALVVTSIEIAQVVNLPTVPSMMAFTVSTVPPPPPPAKSATAPVPTKTTAPTPVDADLVVPTATPERIAEEAPKSQGFSGGGANWGVEGGAATTSINHPLFSSAGTTPLPPPRQAEPIRVGGSVDTPALIHRVEPIYPLAAVEARVQGLVVLEATVDARGQVSSASVLRSIPFLDQVAIEAVKKWRYKPLELNGRPVPFILTVTVNFRINA